METSYSPCLARFIELSEALSDDDALDMQREAYSLSSPLLGLQMPDGIDFYDEAVRTRDHSVPVRHYHVRGTDPDALIVYFHGGGWVKGDLNSHHEVVAAMTAATGARMLAVDYPLAPENRHPAQLLSCYEILRYIANDRAGSGDSGPMLVAGDSAGGQIAAAVSMLARRESGPRISGQVLIYPALDHRCNSDSFRRHAAGPLLTSESMSAYWKAMVPENGNTANFVSPLLEQDLSGLPSTIIQLAENDVLHDEAVAFGARLRNEGVPVEVLDGDGMVHGFIRAIGISDGARAKFDLLCSRMVALIERATL